MEIKCRSNGPVFFFSRTAMYDFDTRWSGGAHFLFSQARQNKPVDSGCSYNRTASHSPSHLLYRVKNGSN
jgi:hypothetical protein